MSYLKKQNIKSFIRNRILRIYPAFIVNLLFITLIIGVLVSSSISEYFLNIDYLKLLRSFVNLYIANDTLNIFNSVPYPNAINGSLWTLQFELMCYIMIGFLGFIGYLKPKVIIALFVLFYSLYIAREYFSYDIISMLIGSGFDNIPRLFSYFLIGSLFYFYNDKIIYSLKGVFISISILVIANELMILKVIIVFFLVYICFAIVFSKRIKLNNFSKYGDFSYGMYIYAFPISQLILVLYVDISFYLFIFLSFVATLILAVLSWKIVEYPILKRNK